jgi:hypothetical protein
MLMATRLTVDFHAVESKHAEIHARLENWARWCNGSSGMVLGFCQAIGRASR